MVNLVSSEEEILKNVTGHFPGKVASIYSVYVLSNPNQG